MPRLNGPVHTITKTVHTTNGIIDNEAWAFDTHAIRYRREYGVQAHTTVTRDQISLTADGTPTQLTTWRPPTPSDTEFNQTDWDLEILPHVLRERSDAATRKYTSGPTLPYLVHVVPEGKYKDTVHTWKFLEDGSMEHAISIRRHQSAEWKPYQRWNALNVEVRGWHYFDWRIEILEHDQHGNPITGRRHIIDKQAPEEPDSTPDLVTWEITYR